MTMLKAFGIATVLSVFSLAMKYSTFRTRYPAERPNSPHRRLRHSSFASPPPWAFARAITHERPINLVCAGPYSTAYSNSTSFAMWFWPEWVGRVLRDLSCGTLATVLLSALAFSLIHWSKGLVSLTVTYLANLLLAAVYRGRAGFGQRWRRNMSPTCYCSCET